jgi:ABC-type branched-subunit amino acid transport system ATPase component
MVDDFCERILQLVKTGKTILLIEHNVDIVLRLSDWVVVMHQGSKIAEGLPDDVRHNVAVMETYLGLG